MLKGKIGIVGSGLIGKQWTMLFASQGYTVVLYDVISEQLAQALSTIKHELIEFEEAGFLRGSLSAQDQINLISGSESIQDCVEDAIYVQECVPDQLELKKSVFAELDTLVGDDTVISTSSAVLPVSLYTEHLKHRSHCLVSHPVNPPYHMPLVELVPSPWTDPAVLDRTKVLMTEIGQTPIVLKREVPGLIQVRLQFAVIQEALKLVADDIMSVEDVDKIMTQGLGLRYSFMGVLETAHLNAEGHSNYRDRYGDIVYDTQKLMELNPAVSMDPDGELMRTVHQQLCKVVPMEKLAERQKWRDQSIASLAKLKKDTDSKDNN